MKTSCFPGSSGKDCSKSTCPGQDGGCSGHGTCILGVCHCDQVKIFFFLKKNYLLISFFNNKK